jgi:glycosyltransferase involved in cell wall biosynthesis
VKVLAYGFEKSEIAAYRLRDPMEVLQEKGLAEYRTTEDWKFPKLSPRTGWTGEQAMAEAKKTEGDAEWADVLFTQRYIASSSTIGLEPIIERTEIPWVLDIDDHIMALDPHMQAAPQYRDMHPNELGEAREIESKAEVKEGEVCMRHSKTGKMMAVVLQRDSTLALTHLQIMGADALIVATRPMLNFYRRLRRKDGATGSCFYIPYCVKASRWQGLQKPQDHSPEVWIGWLGADGHEKDFAVMAPLIGDILKRHKHVRFFWKRSNVMELHRLARRYPERCVKFNKWVPRDEWPTYYSLTGLDIVLAPLKSTPFNDCRSPMKWVEAAMLKKPCICSRTPGYTDAVRNRKTALLASRPNEWKRALESLIADAGRRQEIGEAAHEVAMQTHTLEQNAHLYVEAFSKVRRRTPCAIATP